MENEQAGADVMSQASAQKQKQKVEDKQELFWIDKWNNPGIQQQHHLLNIFLQRTWNFKYTVKPKMTNALLGIEMLS